MAIKLSVTLDSSQAKQELDALKEKIKEVKKSQQGEVSGQNITIKADDQASGRIGEVKKELETLPDKKNINITVPTEGMKEKLKSSFAEVRKSLNDVKGSAVNVMQSFIGGGGVFGILGAGLASLGKLAKYAYDCWINGMKEAGEMAQRNAASIRESAEENEKLRQKTDGYMNSLSSLAANEKLSNANKAEARKLIDDLSKSYGDLGIKLDETTGKLTGVDSAMVKKAQKDKERRIKELEAELKQIQADNEAQAKVRDSAGIPVWFTGSVRIGGEEEQKEAAAKIEENNKRAMEIRKKLHEFRKEDPAEDLKKYRKAEVEDLKNARKEQEEAFARQKKDDALADEKDYDKKIANRQALLEQQKREKVNPLEEKVKAAKTSFQNAKTDIDKLEAEKNLLQLQKELQGEYEKVYAIQREISGLKNEQLEKEKAEKQAVVEREKAEKQALENRKKEVEALAASYREQQRNFALKKADDVFVREENYDKKIANRQALLDQLRSNKIAPLEDKVKEARTAVQKAEGKDKLEAEKNLLRLQKELQSEYEKVYAYELQIADLRKEAAKTSSEKEKKSSGYFDELARTYNPEAAREAEKQKALQEAEKLKGGKLSSDEVSLVTKLAELTQSSSATRELKVGDTSIKTNSLTARGGFQSGAVAPDKDRINQVISTTVKAIQQQQKEIRNLVNDIKKALT